MKTHIQAHIEYLVAKEIVLNAGRISGIILFFSLIDHQLKPQFVQTFAWFLVPIPFIIYLLSTRFVNIKATEKR